jgi:hypothetical protein
MIRIENRNIMNNTLLDCLIYPIPTFQRRIFKKLFPNFSASPASITLQIVQIYNKEDLAEVRLVEALILRSQLKKPEIEERSLRRKKYGS